MQNHYTALIKQDGDFWIGWIKEIPGINCQEYSKQELLKTLKITLAEAIEFNENEALQYVGNNYCEESILL